MSTLYDELEISPNASTKNIKVAYRSLAQHFHPDRNPACGLIEATRRTQRINDAYAVLSDPQKRAAYDRELKNSQEQIEYVQHQQASQNWTTEQHESEWGTRWSTWARDNDLRQRGWTRYSGDKSGRMTSRWQTYNSKKIGRSIVFVFCTIVSITWAWLIILLGITYGIWALVT